MRSAKEHKPISLAELKDFAATGPEEVPMSSLTLDCTHLCCFRCPNCIESSAMRQSRQSSLRFVTIRNLIKQFAERGGTEILLYGGEPTLHEDFPQIIAFAAEHVNSVHVITNGSQLHKDRIAAAIRCATKCTNVEVRVSVNTGTPETHNRLHGVEGHFSRVVSGMQKLTSENSGVSLGFSFLAQQANAYEIVQAYDIATEVKAAYFAIRPLTGAHGIGLVQMDKSANNAILNAMNTLISRSHDTGTPEVRVDAYYPEFLASGLQPDTSKRYARCYYCGNSRIIVTPPDPGIAWACTYWRGEAHFKIADMAQVPFGSEEFEKCRLNVVRRIRPEINCSKVICNRREANMAIYERRLVAKELQQPILLGVS